MVTLVDASGAATADGQMRTRSVRSDVLTQMNVPVGGVFLVVSTLPLPANPYL